MVSVLEVTFFFCFEKKVEAVCQAELGYRMLRISCSKKKKKKITALKVLMLGRSLACLSPHPISSRGDKAQV